MITAGDVARVVAETGFRPEIVEKVLRLEGILDRLTRHSLLRGAGEMRLGLSTGERHAAWRRLEVLLGPARAVVG